MDISDELSDISNAPCSAVSGAGLFIFWDMAAKRLVKVHKLTKNSKVKKTGERPGSFAVKKNKNQTRFNPRDFSLISQIARETPYSPEYLSFLVRKGRIFGQKIGRN